MKRRDEENMKRSTRIFSVLSWAAVALVLAVCTASQGYAWNRGAMLSPTRVVIEGRDRAAVIKLINPD